MSSHNFILAIVWITLALLPGSLPAEEVDNASARAFNAAAALQNAGLHERAAQRWEEFVAKYPKDERLGRANYYLGVCRLRNQKYAEAVKVFQNVLAKWPNLAQADRAQYNLAMALYEIAAADQQADAFRKAASEFGGLVTKYGNSDFVDDALYYQGDSLLNAGDVAAAIPSYQRLISQHASSPHVARAYYDLGIAQQDAQQTEAAIETYRAFLSKAEHAKHELAAEIRLRLGLCLSQQDKLDEAAEQFALAAQVPEFELASYAAVRLGRVRLDQQQLPQAIAVLKDFAKQYPNSEHALEAATILGHCYVLDNKPQEAVRVLAPVVKSNDPPAAEAAYWLGRAQRKLKQPQQALTTLEAAIGRFANSPFLAYLQFARIDALYDLPPRRPETPALYEAFWREHGGHPLAAQAAYMASLAAFGLRDYAQARKVAEAFLANPDERSNSLAPDLKYIAAESHLLESPDKSDSRNKAEALYRDLVSNHPKHAKTPHSQLRIGWCLQTADKHQDAINHLRGVVASLDKSQQQPEAYLLIGRAHADLNQLREAVTALQASLAANGNWERIDEVLFAQAEAHRSLGESDPASQVLRRLVDDHAQSQFRPQAMYWLGELDQQQNRPDEAINWFNQVATQAADSELAAPAMHAIAAIHLSRQQHPQAIEWATRLIDGKASDPLKQRGRYLRGIAQHAQQAYQPAINDLIAYRQQPAQADEAVNSAYTLALCHLELDQTAQARTVLNELLKQAPDYPQADKAFYELAHAFRVQQDKTKEALEAFQWIATNRPGSELAAESWFRVAQLQADVAGTVEGDAQQAAQAKAEQALQQGLEVVKDPALRENMLYVLGDLQFQQNRFDAAAETLTRQIAQLPQGKYVGPATFLAAQSRYALNQFEAALPLFAKIAELDFPDTPDDQVKSYRSQALYRAGECAAKLKRWPESQAFFQKLVDQDPSFVQRSEALYSIGFAAQQQNQLDDAIQVYQQVTEQTETETAAKARFMIGEIEFGRKKYENAIEHFLLVTVGYAYESWQALARFETARCFNELGNTDKARETLQEMIAKHPDHERTADAKRMLAELNK